MSENDKSENDQRQNDQPDDETQPVRHEGAASEPTPAPATTTAEAAAAEVPVPAATPPARRGFRERFRAARQSDGNRAYSLGALIASALAGVIVGGIGVATVNAVTHDRHDGPGWGELRGPMGRDFGDRRGPMFGGPGGVPGQVQPSTPPEDDESGSSS